MKSLSIKIVSLIWLFGLGIFVCIFYAETLKTHIFQVCAGRLTQAWTCINAHDKVRVIDGVEHYSMQRIYSTEENNCVMLDQLLNKWTCKNVFNCAHLPPYWKTKNSIFEVYFAYVMQSIRIRQIDMIKAFIQ